MPKRGEDSREFGLELDRKVKEYLTGALLGLGRTGICRFESTEQNSPEDQSGIDGCFIFNRGEISIPVDFACGKRDYIEQKRENIRMINRGRGSRREPLLMLIAFTGPEAQKIVGGELSGEEVLEMVIKKLVKELKENDPGVLASITDSLMGLVVHEEEENRRSRRKPRRWRRALQPAAG